MIIYILTFVIAIIFSYIAECNQNNKKIYYVCIGVIVLLLSVVAGVRDIGVGTDTLTYSESYFILGSSCKSLKDVLCYDGNSIDKAYLLLNYLGSLFSNNVWIALFLTEFVISAVIFMGASLYFKRTKGLTLFTFFYLFIFYNQSLNYMRQMCAVSFVFVAFYFFIKKKWIIAVLLSVISYYFHSSGILGLFIPIFYYICQLENKKLRNLYLCIAFIFSIVLYSNFYYYLGLIGNSSLISDVYVDRYGNSSTYIGMVKFPKTDLLIMSFIYIFYYISLKQNLVNKNICLFGFVIHTFYIIIYMFSTFVVFLYRMSLYFYIIDIILLVMILTSVKGYRIIRCLFYFIVILSWYYLYIIKNSCETYPYTSRILGL